MNMEIIRARRLSSFFGKEDLNEFKLYKWIEFLLVYSPEMRPTIRHALR